MYISLTLPCQSFLNPPHFLLLLFNLACHSPSPQKASGNKWRPSLVNYMQHDLMMVLFCMSCKKMYITYIFYRKHHRSHLTKNSQSLTWNRPKTVQEGMANKLRQIRVLFSFIVETNSFYVFEVLETEANSWKFILEMNTVRTTEANF